MSRGRRATFITYDEAGRISRSAMSMNKRHIVAATAIPCPWCRAEPGESCRNAPAEQARDGIRHVSGVHGARIKDADLAQKTMEVLLGDDTV